MYDTLFSKISYGIHKIIVPESLVIVKVFLSFWVFILYKKMLIYKDEYRRGKGYLYNKNYRF